MPHSTSRSLVPAFATDRDVSLAVKLASELALVSPISIRIEPTFERLRYHLGILFSCHWEFCNAWMEEDKGPQFLETVHMISLKRRFANLLFACVRSLPIGSSFAKHPSIALHHSLQNLEC